MRYRGGGVGHLTTRAATDFFKQDQHPRDQNYSQQDKMDVDDADRHQDNNGFDQDERLRSSDDLGSDVDEQDQLEGSGDEESNRDDEEEETDEEGDGDESKMEQLGFSEL